MLSGIRKCGFTPWIVLDNVPAKMSENPTKNRYGNTEPPADFDLWSSYVRQFVQSLVDEFGRDEVAKWRFRVGTEPDLNPGHWTGTKQQYLKQARAKADHEANPYAIALSNVIAANQAKYERMSKLHSLDPLPKPTIVSSGRMHFDLTMDGHAVVLLQLE